ncbi:hypothetical protein FB451DRAFT_1130686 [Mycena latifolia]|nr:hypothetical protein FB451DRAFT_1130686 [Mycena latifolia]
MHPLFEYTHLDHAPISCDIAYPPSPRSVLDRRTRTPIPDETLDEPATEPARYTQLVLKCDLFPWEVVVRPGAASPSQQSPCASPGKRYPFTRRQPITNRDVLWALYDALAARATADEWESIGSRSRAQRRISHAYEQRCVKLGGGWDAGVRRIDWLEGRTRLVGIALKEGPAGEPDTATLILKIPV